MKKYKVYTNELEWRTYEYIVEAESEEHAKELVTDGEYSDCLYSDFLENEDFKIIDVEELDNED